MIGLKKTFMAMATSCLLLNMASCVNEWPKPDQITYPLTLTVHSDTDWLPDYEMEYTRSRGEASQIMYNFRFYKAGTTTAPVRDITVYSTDFSRKDFTLDVDIPAGSYDIYAWSDICDASGASLYYNSSDFGAITYTLPYEGDSNNKDAFRGMLSFGIDPLIEDLGPRKETIVMKRPMARYMFVATDLADFLDKEATKGKYITPEGRATLTDLDEIGDILANYYVKIIYPLYMPAVFDNYINKPINSWTDVSFEGDINMISAEQARLGFDYVMMNGEESSAQVQLEVYDADNTMISRTNIINVPTLRNRTTIVYGRFLTTLESGGVIIDPDFAGDYNIEYK